MLRQVSGVFGWKVAGIALAFSSQLLLARLLSVSEYGALVYFLTWLGFLSMVVKLGFDNACIRYVASYVGQREWDKFFGLVITAYVVVGFFSVSIAWLLSSSAVHWFFGLGEYGHVLPWLFPLLPLIALQNLTGSVLRGLQVQLTAESLEGVFRSFLLIMLLTLAWWQMPGFRVETVLEQYAIATAVTVLVGLTVVYVKRPSGIVFFRPRFLHREWFSTSTALWFTGGMYLVQGQADILMLGAMRSPDEVAHYGVASRIAGMLGMGLGAVTVIIAPKVAELHGQNRPKNEFQIYLKDASRILMIFSFGVGGGLILFGKPILWLFGEAYMAAYWVMVILIIGRIVESAAGPVGQLLAMTGNHWAVSRILLLSTVLNLVMNATFIPLWGALGAATTTAISFVAWNIALLIYAWRKLGFNPSILPDYFVKTSGSTTL